MDCEKKRTRNCNHRKCQFPEKTSHGYQCIDIVIGYCEVGKGCFSGCPYSWDPNNEAEAREVEAAWASAARGTVTASTAERTLVVIKPNATAKNLIGAVIRKFEDCGFTVIDMQLRRLSLEESKKFYIDHQDKPYYGQYTEFLSSGKIIAIVLEREDAIRMARDLVGSYDPEKALPGTIRREFGIPNERGNFDIVHASDSPEAVKWEIAILFPQYQKQPERLLI